MNFVTLHHSLGRALLVLFLAGMCAGLSSAQSALDLCSSRKFALYNELSLAGETGVKRLHDAYLQVMKSEGFLPSSERDPEKWKRRHEKRRALYLDPVLAEVHNTIGKIARRSGVALRDGVQLEEAGILLPFDKSLDLTGELIKILNHPDGGSESGPRIEVRDAKIGTIDTERFNDPRSGIPAFKSVDRVKIGINCAGNKDCESVWKYMDEYMRANKFGAILDASVTSAEKLTGPNCKDVTDDFIESYNRQSR